MYGCSMGTQMAPPPAEEPESKSETFGLRGVSFIMGGSTTNTVQVQAPGIWYIAAAVIRVGPPGYFTHVSITTPIAPALKNCYI
jgi:hypothetical protein